MGTENKKHDVDVLLHKAMESKEKPDDFLVHRLKSKLDNKERYPMKNKRIFKPAVAIAAVLITTMSLSIVAFGDQIWRPLQTRVVEGEQHVEHLSLKISEDGFTMGTMQMAEGAQDERVVVEVEGELQVWQDPLILTSLSEAVALFAGDEVPMLPTYLPEGFTFERARFSICPVNNADIEYAGGQLMIFYSNGDESFILEIRKQHERYGFDYWGGNLEEITINGRTALIGDGGLSVHTSSQIRNTFFNAHNIDDETLIRMAESFR